MTKHFRPLLAASTVAMMASAPAAFADVTASDVLSQWKDYVARSGQTLTTGSEDMSGNVLTVTDMSFKQDTPEMSLDVTMDSVTFTENGDGTVSIAMPDSYPIVIDIMPPDEDPVKVTASVQSQGMMVTVSGTPEEMSYAYSADSLSVMLDQIDAPNAKDMTVDASVKLSGVDGTYDIGSGAVAAFTSTMAASGFDLTLDMDVPSEKGALKLAMTASDLSMTSDGTMPEGVDYQDMTAALGAGFAFTGGMKLSNLSQDFEFKDGADTMSGTSTAETGSLDMAMSSDGLSYKTAGTVLDMTLSGSSIPLPQVHLTMAETGFGITMPVTKSDTPKDLGLLLRLVDLTVPEEIWGMADPGGALPHDPATLILDLKGTGNWLIDIMSPDAGKGMSPGGMPGELHTLDIDEMELTAVGASLTGTGGFTFDNEDLMTWGGMPAPDGSVNLKLVGGNALIDKLVAMGIVPQDQAMGAKMMMGMFAKPAGEDTMTSEIKVTKDGHIFANGQQLQ